MNDDVRPICMHERPVTKELLEEIKATFKILKGHDHDWLYKYIQEYILALKRYADKREQETIDKISINLSSFYRKLMEQIDL